MKNSEEQKGHGKKAVKYEEAMNQAFSEIFQNLKVIEADNKKQRERLDLQRRRGSAPPAHRTKSHVSVFLKRDGNMHFHVSVIFTSRGNVKNSSAT